MLIYSFLFHTHIYIYIHISGCSKRRLGFNSMTDGRALRRGILPQKWSTHDTSTPWRRPGWTVVSSSWTSSWTSSWINHFCWLWYEAVLINFKEYAKLPRFGDAKWHAVDSWTISVKESLKLTTPRYLRWLLAQLFFFWSAGSQSFEKAVWKAGWRCGLLRSVRSPIKNLHLCLCNPLHLRLKGSSRTGRGAGVGLQVPCGQRQKLLGRSVELADAISFFKCPWGSGRHMSTLSSCEHPNKRVWISWSFSGCSSRSVFTLVQSELCGQSNPLTWAGRDHDIGILLQRFLSMEIMQSPWKLLSWVAG